MKRHYYVHRLEKAVYHSQAEWDDRPEGIDYLGVNEHPNPKMAAVFFLGNVSGYSVTDLDRRASDESDS